MKELVLMAPTQIKPEQSPANLYNWTIIDFYSKVRRLQGVIVNTPLIWNINGLKFIQMLKEAEVKKDSKSIEDFIGKCIDKTHEQLKEYGLDFDLEIRDDKIRLGDLLNGDYTQIIKQGKVETKICSVCELNFGTDPQIIKCRKCGVNLSIVDSENLFQDIKKIEIMKKIDEINFFPFSLKNRLIDFVNTLPEEYKLLISKQREYTLEYNGFKLDPRFVAIMTFPILLHNNNYDHKTVIHGDVMKKLDYYLTCHLTSRDLPSTIVSHGLCLGPDKKKLRWQNLDKDSFKLLQKIPKKILRCYFLKHNIFKGITINPNEFETQLIHPTDIYIKLNKMLKKDNSKDKNHISVDETRNSFYQFVNKFEFPRAFNLFEETVNNLWNNTKYDCISKDEKIWLEDLKRLYFGA